MRAIWKFPVPITDETSVLMPNGAVPISVGEQDGDLYLWAEVDPEQGYTKHLFQIRGTGHPFYGDEGNHIGTVQMSNGLVWHVYTTARKAAHGGSDAD